MLRRPSPLVFIFITVFVDMLGYGMILPLLPFYVQQQHGGAAIVGYLSAFYAALQLVSGPVLGALSDRVGRKPILLLCLFGTALAYALFGLANSLLLLFLAALLDGLTGNNLTTAYAYVADITSSENRSRGMGIIGAGFGLGVMAGPALGGLLSSFGLAVPALVAGGIALLNVLYGLILLPESLPPERRTVHQASFNAFSQFAALLQVGPIRAFLFAIFFLNLAFSGLQTNFPLFSHVRFGWDARSNGFFFAFVGVIAVFTQGFLYLRLQPLIKEKRLTLLGLALLAFGMAGMAAAFQSWMLFPFVGLAALGSGLTTPSLSGLVSAQTPPTAQGRLMGGQQVLFSLTTMIGPIMAGLVFEKIAAPAPYYLGSLLALVALGFAIKALRG
jgi:MFS transporter, DHA1 family, tetracycline resistance protein